METAGVLSRIAAKAHPVQHISWNWEGARVKEKKMDKDAICEVLERIAQLFELKGENPFKVRAYTNAANALSNYAGSLSEAARQGTLAKIPGLGQAISSKVAEMIETGGLKYFDELLAEFPKDIFAMLDIPGLGPKKVKTLIDVLGVQSVAELEAAVRDGRVAALPGFGEKSAAKILDGLKQSAKYAGKHLPYRAAVDVRFILEKMGADPNVLRFSAAGSYRRGKELIRDLDFVAASANPAAVIEAFVALDPVVETISRGKTKCSVRLHTGIQADLRVVSNKEYPLALLYFTGSKEHNVKLRNRAQKRGWTLNEYRLAIDEEKSDNAGSDEPPPIEEEADVYAALGLEFIPAELREDAGEIEAAEAGNLPRLVELENLRGIFHVHTTASDGRATLEEMANQAHELGLEYLGIADHSKSSFQANGLDEVRLAEQIAQIAELNAAFDGEFRIFTGTECDILKDGTLDFSDDVLSRLDYVVASIHASLTMPQAEMTKRIIKAISNPYVTMLGHVTGRLLLTREPSQVDIPAVIEAAADTGTIIELNCSPQRLELDWRWWPLAKAKGVKCAINPDAHRLDAFGYLVHGVQIARKGWLRREDVINTLPLGKIEVALKAKRLKHR